jgi:uncharacterized coiled-coil protein SlyX
MDEPAPADRLTTLEESLLFAERSMESLSEQMAAMQKMVDLLACRLARLESRLEEQTRAKEEPGSASAGTSAQDEDVPERG